MFRLLIFGGTTEGRLLAEYCSDNLISADVSVATEYGASILPGSVNVLCGMLDASQMRELIQSGGYSMVIDATHPYATEATENIRLACAETGTPYLRLLRKSSPACGRTVQSMEELIEVLNESSCTVLSTLGSKSLAALTAVKDFRERIWVRVLPSDDILAYCGELGYDTGKVIQEKGPFSTEQNIAHIKMSGAQILLTKESGVTGGYAEKAEAAEKCDITMITLTRPSEDGYSFDEITDIIRRESGI